MKGEKMLQWIECEADVRLADLNQTITEDKTVPLSEEPRNRESNWDWRSQADGFYAPYRYEEELARDDAWVGVEK